MPKSNAEIGVELQSKFELYLLGLVFTVLGLSIQTAHFGIAAVADALELIGWLCLLASALTGILRFQWVPVIYHIFSKQEATEKRIDHIEDQLAQGIDLPVTFIENGQEQQLSGGDAIAKLNGALDELGRQQTAAEARVLWRAQVMKAAFFAGIVCLVLSRGYLPGKTLLLRVASSIFGMS